MNNKNLMIGDWVIDTYTQKPMQIEAVNPMMGNSLEPIPLNEEILKTNGFYHDGSIFETDGFKVKSFALAKHEEIWMYVEKEYIDLRITADMKEGIIIHYVHELQHALRLCGFTDLADNFKV